MVAGNQHGNRGHKDLPVGKPQGWPHSSGEQMDAMPDRMVIVGGKQMYSFVDNTVKTVKYEWYSFVPLFLLEEFNPRVKVANVYFLVIACLQCISDISNTNGLPTFLLPLSVVVAINAVFAALEDMNRHKADNEANSENVNVLNRQTKEFESMRSQDIIVGDIIRINNREVIPADCVILAVHEKSEPAQGICYVETKQLDGETNLKTRFALSGTAGIIKGADELSRFDGLVRMEHPNNLIDAFTGVVDLRKSTLAIPGFSNIEDTASTTTTGGGDAGKKPQLSRKGSSRSGSGKHPLEPVPIQLENLLLRGCYLRNTEYAYGLVLNTGHDTKIMMSNNLSSTKSSTLDASASNEIKKIMMMLFVLCIIGAIGQTIWNSEYDYMNVWYLEGIGNAQEGTNFIIAFFYFFLLHASCIPVSLYVSLSIARAGQTYFMNNDMDMYYARIDAPGCVRTMNLNEDLGKVTHIFSDKTGTLTSNIMNFRKMSVNGKCYGRGITEIGKVSWQLQGKHVPDSLLTDERRARVLSVPNVSFYGPEYAQDMQEIKKNSTKRLRLRSISGSSFGGSFDASEKSFSGVSSGDETTKDDQMSLNQSFFKILALCHDTIAERKSSGSVKLSASNPDDESLVAAAAHFGFKFIDRRDSTCIIENTESKVFGDNSTIRESIKGGIGGLGAAIEGLDDDGGDVEMTEGMYSLDGDKVITHPESSDQPDHPGVVIDKEEIETLQIIKFTSKRKRMSVIIKDTDDKLKLLIKGADTAMLPRFSDTPQQRLLLAKTMEHVEQFSKEGLRCLLVGFRELEDEVFEDWIARYEAANADVVELENLKVGLPNKIEDLEDEIEQNITLVGATALEDKLQDGVPECIASLAEAGLVIWMLTGDKEETAINIAIACNLLAPEEYMEHIIINQKKAQSRSQMHDVLSEALARAQLQADHHAGNKLAGKPRALVIDGPSLIIAMDKTPGGEEEDASGGDARGRAGSRDYSRVPISAPSSSPPAQMQTSDNASVLRSATPVDADLGTSESIIEEGDEDWRDAGSDSNNLARSGGKSSICKQCIGSAPIQHHENFKQMSTRDLLLELSKYCKAVVACRVSPDQKREMVMLIREGSPDREDVLTLAVGDGANDVPMIQGAHIGVGIRGEEGQQAVNSSDYAIAQFEYLRPLILKHGRYNYIRLSNEICYIFYKNVLVSVSMWWFNMFCGWSGQKFFSEGPIQMFNLLFTAIPILLYAIYDRDMDYESVLAFPRIYASRDKRNAHFNTNIFWAWVCSALVESCVITSLSVLFMAGAGSLGYNETFWTSGTVAYTLVVLIVNLKLFSIQSSLHWMTFLTVLLSIGVWMLFGYVVNMSLTLSFSDWYEIFSHTVSLGTSWLVITLVVGMCIVSIVLVQGTSRMLFYSNSHILQEMHPPPSAGAKGSSSVPGDEGDILDDDIDHGGETWSTRESAPVGQQRQRAHADS
jgi:magnesium-transporting ATPase (P-type)